MALLYDRSAVKGWAKSQIPLFWERRLFIAVGVAAFLLLYFFRGVVEVFAVMAAFIVLGVASLMYNRWIKVSLGFELVMLGTVVTGVLYGRLPAFVVGFVGLFLAEVLTDRFTYSTFISFIGIFAVAMVVPSFEPFSVTSAGIWMTLLYDAIILPGYMIMGSSPARSFLFFVTHVAFNVWVFAVFAPGIVSFMS